MRQLLCRIGRVALLLTITSPVFAQSDFYAARVEVPDRSDAALALGAREAMNRVLIRVSGNEDIAQNPTVAAALRVARDRIALYSFEQDEGQIYLQATFDDVLVKSILRESDATFWSEDRPPVLLWLVVDEPYSRRFATVSQDGDLLLELSEAFTARGIDLRLPLLDLEDAAKLSPEMVWQRVAGRIRAASQRYGTEHILVGRYVQLTTGSQIADWLYLDSEDQRQVQIQGTNPTPVVRAGVDLAVDAMADRYAVILESTPGQSFIAVTVTGVESFTDYQSVMDILRQLPVLDSLTVDEIYGDRLGVRVTGLSDAEALARVLPGRSRLGVLGDISTRRINLHWGQP
ncbi:MAG: DUF2066 domain-containing protein [Luminiphilus sp.]|nr:DUF2066 domain-containing protein [Luminiphilus sp.]